MKSLDKLITEITKDINKHYKATRKAAKDPEIRDTSIDHNIDERRKELDEMAPEEGETHDPRR